ncbi:MAG: hypothetical protein Kow0025_00270 [Thermodesulfovibrionales bacterium]
MPPKKKKTASPRKAAGKSATKKAARKKAAPAGAAAKKAVKKAAPKRAPKKTAPKKALKKAVSRKAAPTKAAKKTAPRKAAARKPAPAKAAPGRVEGKERLDALRKLLLEKREQIARETQEEISRYIKGENRQLVESALDDGDWSVIDLSEDINLRKLATNRDALLKIDESLRKINEGTYGVCEDCGEEIPTDRLRVLPFAIYCRDCQEKREEMEAAQDIRSM